MGFRIARIRIDGVLIGVGGFRDAARCGENVAEVGVGLGMLGNEGNCRLQQVQRLIW